MTILKAEIICVNSKHFHNNNHSKHFSLSDDGTVENLNEADSYVSHYSTSNNQCGASVRFPIRLAVGGRLS